MWIVIPYTYRYSKLRIYYIYFSQKVYQIILSSCHDSQYERSILSKMKEKEISFEYICDLWSGDSDKNSIQILGSSHWLMFVLGFLERSKVTFHIKGTFHEVGGLLNRTFCYHLFNKGSSGVSGYLDHLPPQ